MRMKKPRKHPEYRRTPDAFSLVEMLVVVALAAMILVGTLAVYNRVRSDAAVIFDKLDENRLAQEVLQRISEDVDRIVAPGFDATLEIRNKVDNGLYAAQLVIENKYYGGEPARAQIYERVVWQSMYDSFEDAMLLYRMHTGLNVEDKVLDENKEERELNMYIPVASGMTFFEVQVVDNQKLIPQWVQKTLPKGIRIGISFAPLERDLSGQWVVPEDKILYRTVAVDRTRKITYKFKPKVFDANDFLREDYDLRDASLGGEDNPDMTEFEEKEQPTIDNEP